MMRALMALPGGFWGCAVSFLCCSFTGLKSGCLLLP